VVSENDVPNPVAAPLWGLGRTIALEYPEIWGGLVDLDPRGDLEPQAELLVRAVLASDGEDQVAIRAEARYSARLRHCVPPAGARPQFDANACYLVTGGLGGLGLLVTKWLAQQGARRLIVTGRSGVTLEKQRTALREMERLGATVRLMQADISDPAQVARL